VGVEGQQLIFVSTNPNKALEAERVLGMPSETSSTIKRW
jgi:hypothetical protein